MTRDLAAALIVVVFLCLFFYKLGQASEVVRALREGGPRRTEASAGASSSASGLSEPSPSLSVFDQEARHLEVVDS